jgi:hypothetical protein
MEICFVFLFLAVCYFMKTEMRSLFNFFLSSFVCPMLRFWFPQRNKGPLWNGTPLWDTTWGNTSVHVLMIGGLLLSWMFQGIDHLFLGFLFLQAIPEIQRRFWMKPVQHVYLVVGILIVCFPFYSIGLMAWYFPSYLEYLPKPYLQWLCWLANASPEVPDYYSVLGVSPDADMKTIKKVFREQAIELHPDKVRTNTSAARSLHRTNERRARSERIRLCCSICYDMMQYNMCTERVSALDNPHMAPRSCGTSAACARTPCGAYGWLRASLPPPSSRAAGLSFLASLCEVHPRPHDLDHSALSRPDASCSLLSPRTHHPAHSSVLNECQAALPAHGLRLPLSLACPCSPLAPAGSVVPCEDSVYSFVLPTV